MKIERTYNSIFFKQETYREAIELVKLTCERSESKPEFRSLSVTYREDSITLDETEEGFEEFLQMNNPSAEFSYVGFGNYSDSSIIVTFYGNYSFKTKVEVSGKNKVEINKILRIFDETKNRRIKEEQKPKKKKPKIFLGHGRSNQWEKLKNHLQDKHGMDVIAYETGARAGHTIRDILDEMSSEATIAFLLHTAEDELVDGKANARPNVIHETGLFQGKLGFPRAIVILEEDCEEYSNLAGIQQIRYSKNNIKEVFGEVIATVRREFGTL